jgi:hypothetical protein
MARRAAYLRNQPTAHYENAEEWIITYPSPFAFAKKKPLQVLVLVV